MLMDEINRRAMGSVEAVGAYAQWNELSTPERLLFERVSDEMRNQPILDIGVGGGRTTAPLLSISRDYTGIDYTEKMVASCQQRFPGVKFLLMDARDMAAFDAESFALVTFACNGLGMVNHEDRLKILDEVYRVLKRGGIFLFSNHNQHCPDHDAGMVLPDIQFSPNTSWPKLVGKFALVAYRTGVRWRNYKRFSRLDVRNPEYSIINDRCHDYSVMSYYINYKKQRQQLERLGFQKNAEAYDLDGHRIPDDGDTTDSSIMYLARK